MWGWRGSASGHNPVGHLTKRVGLVLRDRSLHCTEAVAPSPGLRGGARQVGRPTAIAMGLGMCACSGSDAEPARPHSAAQLRASMRVRQRRN